MTDASDESPESSTPKVRKAPPKKRELKSAKRKGGVPAIQKNKKKSKKWWYIGGGVIVVFILLTIFLPKIGTPRFGICKTYIQMHDPYPSFIDYIAAEEFSNVVEIDYDRIDAFGQRTLNQMRCVFKTDGNLNELKSIDLNGKGSVYPLEDPAEVETFNQSIPAILEASPSLIMPKGLPDDIKDYK